MENLLYALAAIWFLTALLAAMIADRKRHNAPAWFLWGALFGPLAVLVILTLAARAPAGARYR